MVEFFSQVVVCLRLIVGGKGGGVYFFHFVLKPSKNEWFLLRLK